MVQLPEIQRGLQPLYIFDELKPEQFEAAKRILEQCDLPKSEQDRIKSVFLEIEKELYINENKLKSMDLFATVYPDIVDCTYKIKDEPHPLETIFGQINLVITMVTGILSIVTFVSDLKKHK